MVIIIVEVKYEGRDDQIRTYTLIKENHIYCSFSLKENPDVESGWCTWEYNIGDGFWYVIETSRGEGKGIAQHWFMDVLNEIHLRLIVEKELLDE